MHIPSPAPVDASRRLILVPMGLAALGETKLPVARDCAGAFKANVLLLHVLPEKSAGAGVDSAEAAALAYLDTVVAYLHAAGISATSLVRRGPVAATIVREAREQGANLIILGAPAQPALVRAMVGSVADAVVRSAPCPVVLVQPALEAGTGTPLRSFAESAARAGALVRRAAKRQTVEVSRIVGSVGRVHELAADFRPHRRARRHADEQRLARIRMAMERGQALPPVELYQLGFGYYVLDGHHRVAAARLLGQLALDANVVTFVPSAPVAAAHSHAATTESHQLAGNRLWQSRLNHDVPLRRGHARSQSRPGPRHLRLEASERLSRRGPNFAFTSSGDTQTAG